MPRLFGRSIFRSIEEQEEASPTHEIPSTQYISGPSIVSTRGYIDSVYTTPRSSSDEPEIFNEGVEYPEDTPEAIRIRLTNLEEIERGLEQERRNMEEGRSMYIPYTTTSDVMVRTTLRAGDNYQYWSDGSIESFRASQDMEVRLYREHENESGYETRIDDRYMQTLGGNGYIERIIRYVRREPNRPELGGIPEGGIISAPTQPYIAYGGSGGSYIGLNSTSVLTDVGQVRMVDSQSTRRTYPSYYQTGGSW